MQEWPNLDDVAALVALADEGSFAGAARRLRRDATIVSRRVRALEQRLGVRLAERSTRRVAMTEAGTAYLARVRPLIDALADAGQEAAAYAQGTPRGTLRVSLPTTFGRLWLSPLIVAFLERYPEVTIEAEYSNRFVDLIGERFDLAVRLGELPDSRLVARKVQDQRRLICAAPDYLARKGTPATPHDIADHDCLIFTGRPNPWAWPFADAAPGRRVTVPVRGRIASDDAEVLLDAALRGLGLLYATDWLVAREVAAGSLVAVLGDWPIPHDGAIHVVTPPGALLPTKTRAFSDWIAARLRSPLADGALDQALHRGQA